MSFDLSSVCIGAIAARLNNKGVVELIKSCPIIPENFDASTLGFMKSKKKLKCSNGTVNTYYYKDEDSVSKVEKKRRDVLVRNAKNNFLKAQIGRDISNMIMIVKPDLILAEKNQIYNGVLTSVLLGEIMGNLEGVAASYGIPLIKLTVQEVRKPLNPARVVKEFSKKHSDEYLQSLPDITKAALRDVMQKKYAHLGLNMLTDDEGDACVVFDYWYEHIFKK